MGESCIAIGNALGYGQSVTTGVISALNREVSVSDSSSSTNYTAELIQKIEGEEEVEKMDTLLSLALTGGDYSWI